MKTLLQKLTAWQSSSAFRLMCKMGFVIGLILISRSVFALGDDLLEGTTTQALATINKTGRNWAYIIDGAISLGAFAKTKNPFVFFSVLAVALGITVIYKMAGGSV